MHSPSSVADHTKRAPRAPVAQPNSVPSTPYSRAWKILSDPNEPMCGAVRWGTEETLKMAVTQAATASQGAFRPDTPTSSQPSDAPSSGRHHSQHAERVATPARPQRGGKSGQFGSGSRGAPGARPRQVRVAAHGDP